MSKTLFNIGSAFGVLGGVATLATIFGHLPRVGDAMAATCFAAAFLFTVIASRNK